MVQVSLVVRGDVKIEHLLIVVGTEEIWRLKGEADKLSVEDVVPDRVYVMNGRYSAN